MQTYLIAIFFMIFSSVFSVEAAPFEQKVFNHPEYSEKEKIELLIKSIEDLKDAKFDRNGSLHTAKQAADHLRSKYKNHEKNIKTAKDFIEKIGSKSGMSGKPYYIIYSNGNKISAADFFNKRLGELEKSISKK